MIKKVKKIPSVAVIKNPTVVILRQEAIDIYSTRSKLPSASNGQVKGFDKLLEGLNNLNDDFVTILKKDKSLVFTNKEDQVIGKLTFEART